MNLIFNKGWINRIFRKETIMYKNNQQKTIMNKLKKDNNAQN